MSEYAYLAIRWITQPSYLLVEEAALALLAVSALAAPGAWARWLGGVEKGFARLAARPAASLAAVGVGVIVLRLTLLGLFPVPAARFHDEFGYLLGADTFAHGRLTNPAHPLWEHFESIHIFHQPTYMMQYPPAQSLLLAAGELLGHAWIGVLLGAALMGVSLTWMLRAWTTPAWALVGGILGVTRWCLYTYWMNGYWGGAVAAAGGALALGALGRLWHGGGGWKQALVMGAGLAVLANARPYEGLLLGAGVALAMLVRRRWRAARIALAALAVLIPAGCWMLYYNWRVTGDAWTMPYKVDKEIYGMARPFVFLEPSPDPGYRHADLRAFYDWELSTHQLRRERPVLTTLVNWAVLWRFYFGPALTVALLVGGWRLLRDPRLRPLVGIGLLAAAGLAVETWMFPHYAAPFAALAMLLVVESLRRIREWRAPVAAAVVGACALMVAVPPAAKLAGLAPEPSLSAWWSVQEDWDRPKIEAELKVREGRHLVLVRYGERPSLVEQWTYNAADIDAARIVWAREMGPERDRALLEHFRGRRLWRLDAGAKPARLEEYR